MQFAEWSSEAPTVQNRDKCGSYDFVTLARSAQRRTELLINHPSKLINSVFYYHRSARAIKFARHRPTRHKRVNTASTASRECRRPYGRRAYPLANSLKGLFSREKYAEMDGNEAYYRPARQRRPNSSLIQSVAVHSVRSSFSAVGDSSVAALCRLARNSITRGFRRTIIHGDTSPGSHARPLLSPSLLYLITHCGVLLILILRALNCFVASDSVTLHLIVA